MSADRLLAALEAAARALEARDPETASAELACAEAATRDLDADGYLLAPAERERAVSLHGACAAAAARARAHLLEQLGAAGRGTRALDAYRR